MKTKKFKSENEAFNAVISFQSQNPYFTDIDSRTYKGQYDCFVVISVVTGKVIFTAYYL